MITEDYVSFEIAKLLKEKGFRAVTNRYYNAQYDQIRTVSDSFMMDWNDEEYMKSITMPGAIAIPTHQMALKWLREVHSIFIGISVCERYENPMDMETKVMFFFELLNLKEKQIIDGYSQEYVRTYEEACEAAIKYCLENLI